MWRYGVQELLVACTTVLAEPDASDSVMCAAFDAARAVGDCYGTGRGDRRREWVTLLDAAKNGGHEYSRFVAMRDVAIEARSRSLVAALAKYIDGPTFDEHDGRAVWTMLQCQASIKKRIEKPTFTDWTVELQRIADRVRTDAGEAARREQALRLASSEARLAQAA